MRKSPKPFYAKITKKVCSQTNLVFIGFTALCSKTDFSYISEKETASLFKNGHFKNVHFQKTATQIYSTFLVGTINVGTVNLFDGFSFLKQLNNLVL